MCNLSEEVLYFKCVTLAFEISFKPEYIMKIQCRIIAFLCLLFQLLHIYTNPTTALNCDDVVSKELKTEIQGFQETANNIIKTVLSGLWKGRTHKNIGTFVDKFGPRFPGTKTLEKAIDWAVFRFISNKLDKVSTEKVKILHWVRFVLNSS